MLTPKRSREILESAEVVCSAAEVRAAVQRIAQDATRALAEENPLVLTVMSGAIVFSGHLLPLLNFPLDVDYVHVTRYGNAIRGGELEWKVFPAQAIAGRSVLVLDDILDEGHTLFEIRARVLACGARRFTCAALVDKEIGRPKQIAADFVGVNLPDRYLFGFGMDVSGAWRNLPAIYGLKAGTRIEDQD